MFNLNVICHLKWVMIVGQGKNNKNKKSHVVAHLKRTTSHEPSNNQKISASSHQCPPHIHAHNFDIFFLSNFLVTFAFQTFYVCIYITNGNSTSQLLLGLIRLPSRCHRRYHSFRYDFNFMFSQTSFLMFCMLYLYREPCFFLYVCLFVIR